MSTPKSPIGIVPAALHSRTAGTSCRYGHEATGLCAVTTTVENNNANEAQQKRRRMMAFPGVTESAAQANASPVVYSNSNECDVRSIARCPTKLGAPGLDFETWESTNLRSLVTDFKIAVILNEAGRTNVRPTK